MGTFLVLSEKKEQHKNKLKRQEMQRYKKREKYKETTTKLIFKSKNKETLKMEKTQQPKTNKFTKLKY